MSRIERNPEALSVLRALGGNVDALTLLRAHVALTEGETRPQQEQMVDDFSNALRHKHPMFVQAGTGCGKSFAYTFSLAATPLRAVIATATNQLSEQLIQSDIPAAAETVAKTGKTLTFASLKGRSQYLCLAKADGLNQLSKIEEDQFGDALFEPVDSQRQEDASEVRQLLDWAKTTGTGDRSEAPASNNRAWGQVSTDTANCPGAKNCPFGDRCWAELARAKAAKAQIVVTNHALLAQEFRLAVNGVVDTAIFGARDVIVLDEAHDFPDAITSALTKVVDPRTIRRLGKQASALLGPPDTGREFSELFRESADNLNAAFASLDRGALTALPQPVAAHVRKTVQELITLRASLMAENDRALQAHKPARALRATMLQAQVDDVLDNLAKVLGPAQGMVLWSNAPREGDRDPVYLLLAAPLETGAFIQNALQGRNLLATSATLSLAGDYAPLFNAFGVANKHGWFSDAGSPFNYPKQAMLYVPPPPFPEPVGKERLEHTEAVLKETVKLVKAAGGRTLALFTTTNGAQRAAEELRYRFPGLNVLAHGDAPAELLVKEFAADEHSVLCATMGLWQGVSVPGPSCSLVIIDKIPFPPIDDVLTNARRELVDSQGRDGFREVFLATAATALAQAAGRLIRTTSDKGVVAILDPRLHTKRYGKDLLLTIPDFSLHTDLKAVTDALARLTGGMPSHVPVNSKGPKPKKRAPVKRAAKTRKIGAKKKAN